MAASAQQDTGGDRANADQRPNLSSRFWNYLDGASYESLTYQGSIWIWTECVGIGKAQCAGSAAESTRTVSDS
jgi:hypothetical protein